MQDLPLYVVARDGERWVFRPSMTLVTLMLTGFVAGSAFCLYLAVMVLRSPGDALNVGFGFLFLLVAGLLTVLGAWAWRTRRTPLTVERGGRVCYGERELCAAGTVRAVRVAPSPQCDPGECEVRLELDGGKFVSFPSQYFGNFGTTAQVRPFAEALASALGVGVAGSAEPDATSDRGGIRSSQGSQHE